MSARFPCVVRGCSAGILLEEAEQAALRDKLATPVPGRRGVHFVSINHAWMFSVAAAAYLGRPPGTMVAVCPAHAGQMRAFLTASMKAGPQ